MSRVKYQFLLILSIMILSSCYETRTLLDSATIYPLTDNQGKREFKYEVQVIEKVKGRGGWAFIHNLSLKKYSFDNNEWIYTNSISGKVVADSLIYTSFQRKLEYPWNNSPLKGHVEFKTDSVMIVDLQIPYYKKEKLDHWENCKYNGRYRLILSNDPLPDIEGR